MTSHKKSSMKPVAKAAGTKAPASTVTSSIDTMRAEERKWKTEDAMRTLMRSDDLKKDKSLMRDVQKMAAEQAKKMNGLCGKAK